MSRRALRLVAAAALAAAAPAVLPPVPASATPTHVAVVVSGDRTACVEWHSGMTGSQALTAAADVTWGNRAPYVGMVLQIDGRPGSPDPQQAYWAYFRNGVYSSQGPASTHPAAGSVEGWSYVPADGSTPPAPSGSYASICAGQDPSPTPTRPRSSTPPPPTASTHRAPVTSSAARTGHPAATGTSSAGQPGAGGGPATSAPSRSAATTSRPAGPARTTAATSGVATNSAAPAAGAGPASGTASVLAQAAHRPSQTSRSAFPPWGTALAVGAIAVLGAAGYWFSRRRAGP